MNTVILFTVYNLRYKQLQGKNYYDASDVITVFSLKEVKL